MSDQPAPVVSLRDRIRAKQDLATPEPVEVPEWGETVYVKAMTGLQKEKYVESIRKVTGAGKKQKVEMVLQQSGARLVVQTCCDADGVLLFTPADVAWLSEKSAVALQRVIDAASRLNGLNDEAEDDAKNDSASATATDGSSTD